MGGKSKKIVTDPTVSAYGTSMKQSQKTQIDNYNSAEKTEGATKDANYTAERQTTATKVGTPEYKAVIKKHLDKLTSILGVNK